MVRISIPYLFLEPDHASKEIQFTEDSQLPTQLGEALRCFTDEQTYPRGQQVLIDDLRRHERHTLAAAASIGFIRVPKDEFRRYRRHVPMNFRAQQE